MAIIMSIFKYCENDMPSNKTLYQMLNQLMQFQEEALGKSAQNPQLTRLPVQFPRFASKVVSFFY
jgi:hypothetical protein